jgi:hypothetical protein
MKLKKVINTIMKKIITLAYVIILSTIASAQQLSESDQIYLFHVKTIEDFISRFNDDSTSSVRRGAIKNKLNLTYNRQKSLVDVFDHNNKNLKTDTTIKKFANYVLDTSNHVQLSFGDTNWYCMAYCRFDFKGAEVELPLIFKVVQTGPIQYRWLICGINDIGAKRDYNRVFGADTTVSNEKSEAHKRRPIPPTSQDQSFIGLTRILLEDMQPKTIMDKAFLETDKCQKLVALIRGGDLRFIQASNLSYHFMQVPNYTFEVNLFERAMANSGWLIRNVKYATDADKAKLKTKLLGY